jgi:site-specific recombinase XerD
MSDTKPKPGDDTKPPVTVAKADYPTIDGILRTPAEHGAALKGRARHFYAAARVFYGWARHEHHFPSDPVLLTAEQFAEALDRASKFPGVELLDAAKSKLIGA